MAANEGSAGRKLAATSPKSKVPPGAIPRKANFVLGGLAGWVRKHLVYSFCSCTKRIKAALLETSACVYLNTTLQYRSLIFDGVSVQMPLLKYLVEGCSNCSFFFIVFYTMINFQTIHYTPSWPFISSSSSSSSLPSQLLPTSNKHFTTSTWKYIWGNAVRLRKLFISMENQWRITFHWYSWTYMLDILQWSCLCWIDLNMFVQENFPLALSEMDVICIQFMYDMLCSYRVCVVQCSSR